MSYAAAVMEPKPKGEAICAALKTRGLSPVWMEAETGDRIAIGFEFVSAHPTWTKAFSYDAVHATPNAFIALINEWKNRVRKDIVSNQPSPVVRSLIANHGLHVVLDALEDTPHGH